MGCNNGFSICTVVANERKVKEKSCYIWEIIIFPIASQVQVQLFHLHDGCKCNKKDLPSFIWDAIKIFPSYTWIAIAAKSED
jgi:hypothetical protein